MFCHVTLQLMPKKYPDKNPTRAPDNVSSPVVEPRGRHVCATLSIRRWDERQTFDLHDDHLKTTIRRDYMTLGFAHAKAAADQGGSAGPVTPWVTQVVKRERESIVAFELGSEASAAYR